MVRVGDGERRTVCPLTFYSESGDIMSGDADSSAKTI
jgi:hypothetical protein